MKKFFVMALLSLSLSSFTMAEDFLFKLTKAQLSDNSTGVKLLSLEEEKQVVGGYRYKPSSASWYANYGKSYTTTNSHPFFSSAGQNAINKLRGPCYAPRPYQITGFTRALFYC